jgi:hypothetical protein
MVEVGEGEGRGRKGRSSAQEELRAPRKGAPRE